MVATKSFTAEADLQANTLYLPEDRASAYLVESSPIGSSTISFGGLLHCEPDHAQSDASSAVLL